MARWLKKFFSKKNTDALEYYKSGISKAENNNTNGAIEDYSKTIDHPTVNESLKSMALYNRALVYHVEKQNEEAVADLQRVIKMHGAHAKVKTAAKSKLVRIQKRTGQK